MDCLFLDSSRHNRLHKKHFLFLHENDDNNTFSLKSCPIRFDSRLVTYRKKQNDQSIVEFKEIYKIDMYKNRLEKNTLGEMIIGRKDLLLSSLHKSIWNRRKLLKGRVFNAVSIKSSNTTTIVNKSKDSKGNIVVHYSSSK